MNKVFLNRSMRDYLHDCAVLLLHAKGIAFVSDRDVADAIEHLVEMLEVANDKRVKYAPSEIQATQTDERPRPKPRTHT